MANNSRSPRSKIRQSVVRWTFQQVPLDELCRKVADIGLEGIDVLFPEEYEVPARYGLECSMAFAGLGDNKTIGINRSEHLGDFDAAFRRNAPLAEKAGITRAIALCGPRSQDLTDDAGAQNSIACLKQLAPIAADHGLTICLEPQNSKRDHPSYMCDHIAWAINVCERVGSPNVKLLFDIYHVQIMEGDLIATIQANARWFAHYHTGGVPGRHEIGGAQEINYPAVIEAITATGFTDWVAHEFIPTTDDPFEGLAQAFRICNMTQPNDQV